MEICAFDIIVLLCLIPAILDGVKKGFISQVIGIAVFFVGAWLATSFSGQLFQWIGFHFQNEYWEKIIAFILVFLVVAIALRYLGKLFEKLLKFVMLGWLNKLLGVVFAILKWTLVFCVLISLFNGMNDSLEIMKEETLERSIFYSMFSDISNLALPFIKEFFQSEPVKNVIDTVQPGTAI